MSHQQTNEWTCDRCRATEDDPQQWGRLHCHQVNGVNHLHTRDDKPLDICPDCVKDLKKWWGEKGYER